MLNYKCGRHTNRPRRFSFPTNVPPLTKRTTARRRDDAAVTRAVVNVGTVLDLIRRAAGGDGRRRWQRSGQCAGSGAAAAGRPAGALRKKAFDGGGSHVASIWTIAFLTSVLVRTSSLFDAL